MASDLRLREVSETKLHSKAAMKPRRPRKVLSEQTHEQRLERQLAHEGMTPSQINQSNSRAPTPPGNLLNTPQQGRATTPLSMTPPQRRNVPSKPGVKSPILSSGAPRATGHFDPSMPSGRPPPGAGVGVIDDR